MSDEFEKAMIKNFGRMTDAQKMVGRWAREWLEKQDITVVKYWKAEFKNKETYVNTLMTENQRLRKALEFYANENNYDGMGCVTDGGYTPDGQNEYWPDLGSRAKQALAETGGDDE